MGRLGADPWSCAARERAAKAALGVELGRGGVGDVDRGVDAGTGVLGGIGVFVGSAMAARRPVRHQTQASWQRGGWRVRPRAACLPGGGNGSGDIASWRENGDATTQAGGLSQCKNRWYGPASSAAISCENCDSDCDVGCWCQRCAGAGLAAIGKPR